MQQPYEFGYRSIKALAQIVRGDDPGLADDGLNYVPVRVVDASNVGEFREQLAQQLAAGSGESAP